MKITSKIVGFIGLILAVTVAISTVYVYVGDYNKNEDTTTISNVVSPNITVKVDNHDDKPSYTPSDILPLTATITYPTFDAEKSTTVEGKVSRQLVDGEYMWIVVNPLKAFPHLWPQAGGPIIPRNDLTWRGVASLGGDKEDDFDILVIVVDETLNSKIINWVNYCTSTGNWTPITENCGVVKANFLDKTLDTVSVTQKN